MSCEAINPDADEVVVNAPLSFTERCKLHLKSCLGCLGDCLLQCVGFLPFLCVGCFALFILSALSITGGIVLGRCHKTPMLALEDVSIRSMTVFQNITMDQWQVKSEFNVTLLARNRNSVVGCFSTFRRMVVYVGYHDKLILQQEVPLGFRLKPQGVRLVVVQVEGDNFLVDTQLGQLLQAELRNARSVRLQMYFEARVMRNDRKAKWVRMGCQVTARTPPDASQVSGNLLSKRCRPS